MESKEKTDYQLIMPFAESWVKKQFKWFSSDDLKKAFYMEGHLDVKSPSVFGIVFKELSKKGLIFKIGETKTIHKKAHGRMLSSWISREYKERQKNNASNKGTLNLFEV